MRVVIDGLPITGSSLAIVVEHLLAGWQPLPDADELHLVLGPDAELAVPPGVTVHRVPFGRRPALSRIREQTLTLPRLCRRLRADALLGVLPTTTIASLPCPRAIIAYDLRHELRPQQFGRKAWAVRRFSYGIGFRQADGIACISERTRQDLLRSRPWLRGRPVRVTLLGADHVDGWPADAEAPAYALAFGQYGNKNVDLVLDAWSLLQRRGVALPLALLGLGSVERAATQDRIDRLGLDQLVTALPWLSTAQFRQRFASAGLVVFPSDFEGFGLPAVEAMRRGIPLVVTPEPALLEVTGTLATVMDGWDAEALADAVLRARQTPDEALERARVHAQSFTWTRTAAEVRALLAEIAARAPASPAPGGADVHG